MQVLLQHNKSTDAWQHPPPGTVLSLSVVNPYTQQLTLTIHFTADLVEMELQDTLSKLGKERIALLIAHVIM